MQKSKKVKKDPCDPSVCVFNLHQWTPASPAVNKPLAKSFITLTLPSC